MHQAPRTCMKNQTKPKHETLQRWCRITEHISLCSDLDQSSHFLGEKQKRPTAVCHKTSRGCSVHQFTLEMPVKSISHFQASAALQLAQAELPRVRPMGPAASPASASCQGGPCPLGTSLLYPALVCLRAGREAVSFVSGGAALLWQNTRLAGEVVLCCAALPQSSAPQCLEGHVPAQHQGDVQMLTRPPHTQQRHSGRAWCSSAPSKSQCKQRTCPLTDPGIRSHPVRNTGNRP